MNRKKSITTTAMMSSDLTPTLLPQNENGKILFGSGAVVILVEVSYGKTKKKCCISN